jgi:hypothetical protein
MTEQEQKQEIDAVLDVIVNALKDTQFSNFAVLNATSKLSTNTAVKINLDRKIYLNDLGIMYDQCKESMQSRPKETLQ